MESFLSFLAKDGICRAVLRGGWGREGGGNPGGVAPADLPQAQTFVPLGEGEGRCGLARPGQETQR